MESANCAHKNMKTVCSANFLDVNNVNLVSFSMPAAYNAIIAFLRDAKSVMLMIKLNA